MTPKTSRRTDAQTVTDTLVVLARDVKAPKYQCLGEYEKSAFALGYMSSVLAQVAASSPAAMRKLQEVLQYAKEGV